jgi:ribosome maturation factor RimP
MLENKIEDLLLLKFQEPEFTDCFVIEISIVKKKVEVILDADEGIKLNQCQRVSRHVENWLDTEGPLGEEYTIEVSSPGVSRPLVYLRQYPQHIGRTLEVTDTEGVTTEGELKTVENGQIMLAFEQITKDGKKKIKENIQRTIPFENIKKAIVKLKF